MLKRYTAPGQISWVGAAWQIRQALRQELKQRGAHAKLADLLPVEEGTAGKARRRSASAPRLV